MYKSQKAQPVTPSLLSPPPSKSNTVLNTYLGQKGYTIPVSELSSDQIRWIKEKLLVKPIVNGAPCLESIFSVYRESANKMYVPRYFGETHFGKPKKEKISQGHDVTRFEFVGQMRDNQTAVIETFMQNIHAGKGGGLLELYCGFGKTICALYLCSLLKKKTLIIVHKEFLMNQWIERIGQFLPAAKIGRIQGPIIDIEDKDIVIGMLQSLSMKEYPASVFEEFGFTIIDEVHHISSQVFSRALFKIVTKYMLGLSATMNRKDDTTYIFKMFLGEVIYKSVRKEEFNVIVRAIPYKNDDPDFDEVVLDYRGKVQYSTMISKLCACVDRSEFILRILIDLLKEDEKKPASSTSTMQIMILAHNRNVLTYLHDAICQRNIAPVGYYVGGMKESALKLSESKKVIIATYSMAAEALDIKTLNTLIMATPKTDIEQAVGRILREKHGNPIVVDIIDQHKPFKNQWTKRRGFYNKQNYKIVFPENRNVRLGGSTAYSESDDDDYSNSKKEENDEDFDIDNKKICMINIDGL